MFCRQCGAKNNEGSKFCTSCGANLQGEVDSVEKVVINIGNQVDKEFDSAVNDVKDTILNDNSASNDNANNNPNNNITNSNMVNTNNNYVQRQPLKSDRGLIGVILLTIITCGIYNYFFIHSIAKDMNVALEGDGERTSGLGAYILFSILTCGIYSLYWEYKIANRMQKRAMEKYNVIISENGTSVLLWQLFGVLICGIGPFIALNILIKNSNLCSQLYNQKYVYNQNRN